jgi:hypothetical protein
MAWIALTSELGYLKSLHGPNVLLNLNLAYYAPSLPVLTLQLFLDSVYDMKYGTAITTTVRQGVSLLVCAACCVVLPFISWTKYVSSLNHSRFNVAL